MKNLVLKARIVEKFGTQFNFARSIGVSEDVVSKWITNRIVPKDHEKKAIAQALEVSPDEIWPTS